MGGYAGCLCLLLGGSPRWALAVYSAGLLAFLAHVVLAFGVFYDWSHSVAWDETAKQTKALTGRASGHGLYLNYLFGVVWLADAAWWRRRGTPLHRDHRGIAIGLHVFFLFMIVNGGVIFAAGPVRWFTALLLAGVAASAVLALLRFRRTTSPKA